MQEVSKQLIAKHMIRNRYQQKTQFIDFMKANFSGLQVEEQPKGSFKSRNLVLGNKDTAKVCYTAHYDTPATLGIIPNLIFPKNLFMFIVSQCLLVGVFLLIMLGCDVLVSVIYKNFVMESLMAFDEVLASDIIPLFLNVFVNAILFIGFMLMIYIGKPNKNNFNDNTSGIVTLIELYSKMTEEERATALFVFFDNEEKGMLGSAFFKSTNKNIANNMLVINMDCVSDGDNIAFFPNKLGREFDCAISNSIQQIQQKEEYAHKVAFVSTGFAIYPSDNMMFKKSYGVCALNKHKWFGYYCSKIHTNRDVVFDELNITMLVDILQNLHQAV